MDKYQFSAIIQKHKDMDAAYIEFPYNVEEEFNTKGQVKVIATFDGEEYIGSLVKMGNACHCIGLTKALRSKINKTFGDTVEVTIKQDKEPRTVKIPEDLLKELEKKEIAKIFFNSLSYTNKKAFIQWIEGAKKQETRQKRIDSTLEMLLNSIKHP